MTEEISDDVAVNNEPENEATETQPETEIATPEPEKEEQKRVKIKDVIKDAVECKDCKKTMNIKTLRYSHPNVCEKKPSNIIDKPVKKILELKQKLKLNLWHQKFKKIIQWNINKIKKWHLHFQKLHHPSHNNNHNKNSLYNI